MKNARTFYDWLYNQRPEDTVCVNPFHDIAIKVIGGCSPMDPYMPDENDVHTKVANLLLAGLVLLQGDVIYVREGYTLHPLNESIDLLAYYLHGDSREARKAAEVLETNFQGYFPVVDERVLRDAIVLRNGSDATTVDLKTLSIVEADPSKYREYGVHDVREDNFDAIAEFFALANSSIGDEWFLERMLMYPFKQPFREKSHVLVGNGGNGKSMFMNMVKALYGDKAMVDAPQPNFSGHSAGVIAYNFIGKKVVTFNDVGDPSTQFLEWMKRMITGNLEVKTPGGAWMSVPCMANFFMETNHTPQVLNIEAHRRRFVIREFDPGFKLAQEMAPHMLDKIGDRGDLNAGDIVNYLLQVSDRIDETGWTSFGEIIADNDQPAPGLNPVIGEM